MLKTFDLARGRIVSGAGALLGLPEEMDKLKAKRAIIITDANISALDGFKEAAENIRKSGKEVFIYDAVEPNPTDIDCDRTAEYMKEVKPDVIIAFGGGSPMDCAKAANAVYTMGVPTVECGVAAGGMQKIPPTTLPIIAVPTTAGTGSEVNDLGVIIDTKKHVKFPVKSVNLLPKLIVLDPMITVGLPKAVTAATGIDALTHSIEAYVSLSDFYLGDAAALYAMRQIAENLPKAYNDGSDVQARENMLMASLCAGYAFSFNGLGLCHQMAHQLSSYFNAPHGVANALLLPHVMRFNMVARPDRYADVAKALGCDTYGLDAKAAAIKGAEKVEELCRQMNIPAYLDDIGVDKASVPVLAESAMLDLTGRNNPVKTTIEQCKALYYECFRP